MNKKFFITWIVVFIAWMLGSFIVHGTLLHDDYMKLPNLFRSEADSKQYFPFLLLAHVLMAGAFTWIYSRGVEATAWMPQGVRYGIAVALLAPVATYLIYYAVQPMTSALVIKQIVFDSILCVLLGIIVAFMYRPRP